MDKLVAVMPILFENRFYEPGDALPTHDIGFVEAWIRNGAAVWMREAEAGWPVAEGVKARPAAATAGLVGDAFPSFGPGQDIAGRVPSRKARGIQPEPEYGRRRSHA